MSTQQTARRSPERTPPPPTLPPAEVRSHPEADRVWSHVLERLAAVGVGETAMSNWVRPMQPIGVLGDELCVQGPQHVARWYRRRYGSLAGTIIRTEKTFAGLRIYDLPRSA